MVFSYQDFVETFIWDLHDEEQELLGLLENANWINDKFFNLLSSRVRQLSINSTAVYFYEIIPLPLRVKYLFFQLVRILHFFDIDLKYFPGTGNSVFHVPRCWQRLLGYDFFKS